MRILLVGLIWIVFSCSPTKSEQPKDNNDDLSQNDQRVKRAFALAQDSLSFFIETFNTFHSQAPYNFFIKTKIDNKNNNSFERIWAKPFLVLDSTFKCSLDSNPRNLAEYKFGDTIQVDFDAVEDFMIIIGDSVIGNYLQRELKKSPYPTQK